MKVAFIVANWKSNMTRLEVDEWVSELSLKEAKPNVKIIICPSFVYLPRLSQFVREGKLKTFLGSQDISPFEPGAYTGEVNGLQIKDYAEYVIVGHSERRTNFNEDDMLLNKKVQRALESKLTPIFCVQDASTPIPEGVTIVAYEPVFAIGTGKADSPESASRVAEEIKAKNPGVQYVLYGGSVTLENVKNFGRMESASGVLVGKASLDPIEFGKIVDCF